MKAFPKGFYECEPVENNVGGLQDTGLVWWPPRLPGKTNSFEQKGGMSRSYGSKKKAMHSNAIIEL